VKNLTAEDTENAEKSREWERDGGPGTERFGGEK